MGNCLFLRAQGWGIDHQMKTKLQIPGGMPGGGMVTGRIEPCITTHLHRHMPCCTNFWGELNFCSWVIFCLRELLFAIGKDWLLLLGIYCRVFQGSRVQLQL